LFYLQEQKKSDWRKKREDFIATLRAAKEAQRHLAAGGSLKDLPPPPPMDTSDYIQCPHCGRRSNFYLLQRRHFRKPLTENKTLKIYLLMLCIHHC
jgi:hypothetical protein